MSELIEIWRPMMGYEVSNLGNVRKNNKEVKPYTDSRGRKAILVDRKNVFVHRMIAKAFPEICGEWFDGAVIDHIDTNVSNNIATNLKVCTQHENLMNPITRIKKSLSKKGDKNPMFGKKGKKSHSSKIIVQFDLNNHPVRIYCSITEVSAFGFNYKSVSQALNKKIKTSGGYIWRYLNDYLADILEEIQDEDMVKEKAA